ncbi:MAG TPA: hypothetical protein PKD51_18780 [Saprospiraceae bacterium]|nr:hypothetical protein [Saprospiraceae bacterium]
MKQIIFLFIMVNLGIFSAHGQKSTFTQKVTKLNISNSLKAKAITAYNATKDPCWDGDGPVTKDCTDLKDPWGDDPIPSSPPVDTSTRLTAFYAFEKDILDGKGGLNLPGKLVKDAWNIHPGYSLKAMRARLDYYSLKIDK